MNVEFSTTDLKNAEDYLRKSKPPLTDDSLQKILSEVKNGSVRILDPMMYGNPGISIQDAFYENHPGIDAHVFLHSLAEYEPQGRPPR